MIGFFGDFSDFIINRARNGTFDSESNARMATFIAQCGRCYVTNRPLKAGYRQLHRLLPGYLGGKYIAENTIYVCLPIHRLVHGTHPLQINRLLEEINPTPEQMKVINELRVQAKMPLLEYKTVQTDTRAA